MKMREPCVFVVDDDRSVRTSLANLLATEDYAVEIFASAANEARCDRFFAKAL
jgi:FixJ family two-component response regulator